MRKSVLVVVLGLAVLVIAFSVVLVGAGYLDTRAIESAARATPEVASDELVGDGAGATAALARDVNPATVRLLGDVPGVVVIDVRTPDEYASGHIPGTLSIPLDDLAARADEVPRDEGVVFVCRSGNRSAKAATLLADLGHENVHSMRGGMRAWSLAGYPIEP